MTEHGATPTPRFDIFHRYEALTRLHHVLRRHPFTRASLHDEDVSVDFAELTSPSDRVAVVVTEPLTRDEAWVAFTPGEIRVYVDGAPAAG